MNGTCTPIFHTPWDFTKSLRYILKYIYQYTRYIIVPREWHILWTHEIYHPNTWKILKTEWVAWMDVKILRSISFRTYCREQKILHFGEKIVCVFCSSTGKRWRSTFSPPDLKRPRVSGTYYRQNNKKQIKPFQIGLLVFHENRQRKNCFSQPAPKSVSFFSISIWSERLKISLRIRSIIPHSSLPLPLPYILGIFYFCSSPENKKRNYSGSKKSVKRRKKDFPSCHKTKTKTTLGSVGVAPKSLIVELLVIGVDSRALSNRC